MILVMSYISIRFYGLDGHKTMAPPFSNPFHVFTGVICINITQQLTKMLVKIKENEPQL